jgi:hypothetical protein
MENELFNKEREVFLSQGTALIEKELASQAEYVTTLRQSFELKNIDLLSKNIIIKKDINNEIKSKIKEYSLNLRKILIATAHFIEKEKFKTVDEAIENLGLARFDKNRLYSLVAAQKAISFSYGTLVTLIEIFRRSNKNILDEINQLGRANSIDERLDKTALYLKNAIIVYELASFVVDQLSAFGLEGVAELDAIKKDVFSDIDKGRKDDESLTSRLQGSTLEKNTLQEIEQRERIRLRIQEKWDNMMKSIGGQQAKAGEAKGFLSDLEIVRDNAKNRIDILNIASTTILVENSINLIGDLAANINDWVLPPLDERTACELLGLEYN